MTIVAKTGADGAVLSLRAHCLDVAMVMRRLLDEPVLVDRLSLAAELDVAPFRDRIAVLAGLHDIGKADARWQAYVRGEGPRRGHVAPALAALQVDEALHDALMPVAAWTSDPQAMLDAVICHHGGPVPESAVQPLLATADMDRDAISAIRSLVEELLGAYPDAAIELPALPWTPALSHLFAGLLMVADWLASGVMPLTGDAYDTEGRRAMLTRAIQRAGYWAGQTRPVMEATPLRPAQAAIREADPTGRLLILEDMTGSGKTEAAVLWAERLVKAGAVDGLYFALPTRAAATEIHGRIGALVGAAVGALAGRVTRIVPGMIDTDYVRETDEPRSWHLGGSRQAMMAAVGVGTVDQALAAILRARHAWLRRAWLVRRLLVIDEVHAGDAYMLAHVERLVHAQIDAGGYVLTMSATLGSSARARLQRIEAPDVDAARELHYPALWVDHDVRPLPPVRPRSYNIEIAKEAGCLTQVAKAQTSGARVLIVRSTVADALATRDALVARGVPVELHHSRYADHDRRLLDDRVIGILGHRRESGSAPVIVATQTCEQSLDIDADLLVTDACPADVMLQRLGRLHRHARERPFGYDRARAIVLDPGDIGDRLTGQIKQPQRGAPGQGWAWVYPAVPVAATLDWLLARGGIRLPRDARSLVEAATHQEALSRFRGRGTPWEIAWQSYAGTELAERSAAHLLQIPLDQPYGPGCEVDPAAASRLGELPITVETPGMVSPLDGTAIDALPVPARWLRGVEPGALATVDSDGVTIGGRWFSYTRDGLQRLSVH